MFFVIDIELFKCSTLRINLFTPQTFTHYNAAFPEQTAPSKAQQLRLKSFLFVNGNKMYKTKLTISFYVWNKATIKAVTLCCFNFNIAFTHTSRYVDMVCCAICKQYIARCCCAFSHIIEIGSQMLENSSSRYGSKPTVTTRSHFIKIHTGLPTV